MKTQRILAFITGMLAYGFATLLQAQPLSIEAARASAIADNPGLAEMQARFAALREVVPQQAALPDPVLSFGAMNFPWDEFDRNQENMTQLQVGVSQMFPYPGKLQLREDIAAFEAEVARHSVEEMRIRLDLNVTSTWWEIYFIDRSLETVLRNQDLLRQFVDIAKKKYEVGKGLQQDVLLAQLELSKLLDQEIRIAALREHKQTGLNVLMGRSPAHAIQLAGVSEAQLPPLASQETLYARALAARPVLHAKRSTLQASESRLELAKKQYYPDFKVGVTYGNRDDDDLGQSRQDFLSLMVSVNVPLYTGSKQDRAVQQHSRELEKSRYALADERNLVMSSVTMATTDFSRAVEQVSLYKQGIIPQARQTVASMQAGYQVDEVDFLNLVRSQITLLNYELQYLKSYTEMNQAIARLVAAVGEDYVYE